MAKITTRQIAEAIYESTEGKSADSLSLVIKNAVITIKNKKLFGKSKEILWYLQDIYDKKDGVVRAKISSAKLLSEQERKVIEENLKTKYNAKKIESEYFEKKELLGGMKVEVGNEVWDDTYRNKLQQLSRYLIKN